MALKRTVKSWVPPRLLDLYRSTTSRLDIHQYRHILRENKSLEGIHKGQRVFILGSGPSIKKEDLTPLRNECVIALNNFFVHKQFDNIMSGTQSKYYMTAPIHPPQTENEWMRWFSELAENVPKSAKMVFGLNKNTPSSLNITAKYNLFEEHERFYYYTAKEVDGYYNYEQKHFDICKGIWHAETVSIYALVWALYLGFEEIILIGMDHNYFLFEKESEMRMYESATHQKDEFQRAFGDNFYIREYNRQFNIFNKYQMINDLYGTKVAIFNASRDSLLKVFPKVELKSFFNV